MKNRVKYLKAGMLVTAIFAMFGLISFGQHAYASPFDPFAKTCDADTAGAAGCPQGPTIENPITGPNGILSKVSNIIAAVGGVIAVAMIVFGGLQIILSGGESQKVANGRNIIIYSAVGIVVIIMARVIISFVLNKVF